MLEEKGKEVSRKPNEKERKDKKTRRLVMENNLCLVEIPQIKNKKNNREIIIKKIAPGIVVDSCNPALQEDRTGDHLSPGV